MDKIIKSTLKVICPFIALYSIYLLLRGHNLPGGGFAGGLVLTLSFILFELLYNKRRTVSIIKKSNAISYLGCLLLLLSFVILLPIYFGLSPFQGLWSDFKIPLLGKFSSVFIFDFFIYLIVCISSTLSFHFFYEFRKGHQCI